MITMDNTKTYAFTATRVYCLNFPNAHPLPICRFSSKTLLLGCSASIILDLISTGSHMKDMFNPDKMYVNDFFANSVRNKK